MLRVIFADASYWIALLNSRDELHGKAVQLSRDIQPVRIVTSEMILTEVLNDFSKRGDYLRINAVEFVERIRIDLNVTVLSQDSDELQKAAKLYRKRSDKKWSHTDCMSFIIMEERGISEALTFDKHFSQAGYVALMRS